MERLEKYGRWVMAFIFAIAVIAVYKTFDNFSKIIDLVKMVWHALTPFVIGFIIAYIFNMPCKKLDKAMKNSKRAFFNKNSKVLSVILVYLTALLILMVIIRSIVPAIYKNVVDLYYNVPKYFNQTMSVLTKWQQEHNIALFEVDELTATNTFNNIISSIDIAQFSKYAQGVVKVTSGVVNILIGIIASVYMLVEKERIIASGKRICRVIFKEKTANKVIKGIAEVNQIFSKYIFCLLLDAVIVMILVTIVLSLLGVKYAIILGIFIGACNLIPYFGAIIASSSGVFITLITGGVLKAVWTAISLLILQQIDGNFIGPKIMGEVLNISPLWIIFAVTLGGGLFGITGMVISVPIFMVLKMIFDEIIKHAELRKVGKNE